MHARPLALAALVAVAVACDQPATAPEALSPSANPSASLSAAPSSPDQLTPFQRSVMQSIEERQAQGLPVPSASYEYEEVAPLGIAAAGPGEVTIIAKTVLQFENVAQAGMSEWPAIVVGGAVPEGATGFVRAGDYTQFAKDEIAKKYPDAWSGVSFETGPRIYTVAETLVVSGPQQLEQLMDVQLQGLQAVTAVDELLLGFTLEGPGIDYHVDWDLGICLVWFFGCRVEVELVSFWAGFVLDWTIGMRLPVAMEVASPGTLMEGGIIDLTSTATGRDWSAADFEAANVSPEQGNEYVLQFNFGAGVFLTVAGYDAVNIGVQPMELDRTASFATPLGGLITLPSLDVPLWGFNAAVANAEIGLMLTPNVGTDHFVVDWLATAEGSGIGTANYTSSGSAVPFAGVTAIDGPGNAAVQLSGFRYYFSQFYLDFGVYFSFHVLGWGDRYNLEVTDFDLSSVLGRLWVGPHSGTTSMLALQIPIENVPPTVNLARTGALPINGGSTWLGRPGQLFEFAGVASDPGRDDLTLTWDWGDGPPGPGTHYPVPHQVSESRAHAFANACLYAVSLSAVDDEQAAGEDRVAVVVTGNAGARARHDGYWQHQLDRNGNSDYSDAELQCYLGIVAHMSAVFGERRPIATLLEAHDVLFMKQNGGDPREQLDRQLLVAWLNFAAGAIGYDALVDQNGDGEVETTLGDALAEIETARLRADATDREIRDLTKVVQRISASTGDLAAGQR